MHLEFSDLHEREIGYPVTLREFLVNKDIQNPTLARRMLMGKNQRYRPSRGKNHIPIAAAVIRGEVELWFP